jgi:hypothetical protein
LDWAENHGQSMTFDVKGVTLLMKGKIPSSHLCEAVWPLPESNRDADQFATILLGNHVHRVCVL